MADKEVIIGTGDNKINMLWGTGVKESPEISESSTNTFSGAIVQGLQDVPYTLEIGRLRYDDAKTHLRLSMKVEDMMQFGDDISVVEVVRPKAPAEPYKITTTYINCITTGNDYEIKTDENTAESLKFKAARRTRKYTDMNGTEITL